MRFALHFTSSKQKWFNYSLRLTGFWPESTDIRDTDSSASVIRKGWVLHPRNTPWSMGLFWYYMRISLLFRIAKFKSWCLFFPWVGQWGRTMTNKWVVLFFFLFELHPYTNKAGLCRHSDLPKIVHLSDRCFLPCQAGWRLQCYYIQKDLLWSYKITLCCKIHL